MSKPIFKTIALFMAVILLVCTVPISASAAIPTIPALSAKYEIVDSYSGFIKSTTVPAGKNMYTSDGGAYRMMGNLPYYFTNLSEVDYIEIDIYVSVATTNSFGFWVTNNWDAATVRGKVYLPALNAGWNHVVVSVSNVVGSNGFKFNSYDRWSSIFFEGSPSSTNDVTVAFGNIILSKASPNIVPTASYQYDVVESRSIDLKGEKNNFSDERYFGWDNYSNGFRDMINNPLDITSGSYIEFDYYSSKSGDVGISLGSLHQANGFQFYDNRSQKKTFEVSKGWNHIVLRTDGAFREIDTTTLKSYNPQRVTGFIIHSADTDYLRLTNVALTADMSVINDPVLNYRDDFAWGSMIHAREWGSSFKASNLELQLQQLASVGCKLLRVDIRDTSYDQLDKTVKLCNAYGIKVMGIAYMPGRTFDPNATVNYDYLKQYYREIATRYDGKHGCGKIDYLQIDNELDNHLIGYAGGGGNFMNISDFPKASLEKIASQVDTAIDAVHEANPDMKTIINIAWVHYGILKYFYEYGVEWDITGHDWYSDMFGYGGNSSEYYAPGPELYKMFGKPIIICETNMFMNIWNGATEYPDYNNPNWWNPLVECFKDYYAKDYVIGCVVYEFWDELGHQKGDTWMGEAHFGMIEADKNGNFIKYKPIYDRCKTIFGGGDVQKLNWSVVEPQKTIWAEYDMKDLISAKKLLLNGKNGYTAKADINFDGLVNSTDFTQIRKKLFKEF